MTLKAGDVLDEWQLVERLGSGGNADVWRAMRAGHGEAALKVLRRESGARRQRFADEVHVMRRFSDHAGVLPLLDASLPEPGEAGAHAWLATRVAEVVRTALGPRPTLAVVVEATHRYALTLAELADQGVGHRDLKPENLFRYDGRWVIGDFGLATYPEKTDLTPGDRRLGPLYFMAPEMLRSPDEAAAGPADVFSLAKTLWVLATGERYPPEGQVRVDVPDHRLGHWIGAEGTASLDLVIERSTDSDAGVRPTMRELAEELGAWSAPGALRNDQVEDILRQRHLDRLGQALSTSLDPGVLQETESAIKALLAEVGPSIEQNRRETQRWIQDEYTELHEQVLRNSGVWGVAQENNTPWIGSVGQTHDFATAVLHQPEPQRETQIRSVWPAVEAVYKSRCGESAELRRPLWWLHTVVLGGCLPLRDEPGCEPVATDFALQESRNHLLGFPDDPITAASWRLQRVLIPVVCRAAGLLPLGDLSAQAQSQLSPEDRIRYRMGPTWFFMMGVRIAVIDYLASINPWSVEQLDHQTHKVAEQLKQTPIPSTQWMGPAGDPWLQSWLEMDPLLMCGLTVLNEDAAGDDLLGDAELTAAIIRAASSEDGLLRRPAWPLAQRLGLL